MRIRLVLAVFGIMIPALLQADNLLEIYQLAAESDPQIKAAEAAYQAVHEGERQARARLLPQADLSASVMRDRQELKTDAPPFFVPGTLYFTNTNYTLSLKQAAYNRDYFVQLRQANAGTSRAEADYNAARQDLIIRVAQRYFDILGAKDNLEFARAEKGAIERQLEQTHQRFEVGLIAITDVQEAQAAFDGAVAQEIDAENTLSIARETLREITGRMHESLRSPKEGMPLATPEPIAVDEWIKDALAQNFTLLSAQFGVEVARHDVERGRSGHYPTLDVVASYDYNDRGGSLAQETADTIIGLQLNVPLYQGGGVTSAMHAAQYRLTQAKENLEQQQRATERSTRSAYLNVLASISRVKALRQAVISNQSALDATQAGYEVGTRTIVDVLNAQRLVYKAKSDYARARYDYIINNLKLKQAAGILAVGDVDAINRWLQ